MDNYLDVYVTVGVNGLLTAYSMEEQPGMIHVLSLEEPIDYLNWAVKEGILIHYPEDVSYGAPETKQPAEEIRALQEQNALVMKYVADSLNSQDAIKRMVSELFLETAKNLGGETNE